MQSKLHGRATHTAQPTLYFCAQLDTEGFDALALQGAMRSLAAKRVGVLIFEYHGDLGLSVGARGGTGVHEVKAVLKSPPRPASVLQVRACGRSSSSG